MTLQVNVISGVGQLLVKRDNVAVFIKAESGKLVAVKHAANGTITTQGPEYDMGTSLSRVSGDAFNNVHQLIGHSRMPHDGIFYVQYKKTGDSGSDHMASFSINPTTMAITNVDDVSVVGAGNNPGPLSTADAPSGLITWLDDNGDNIDVYTLTIDTSGNLGTFTSAGTITGRGWSGFNGVYLSGTEYLITNGMNKPAGTINPMIIDLTNPTVITDATVPALSGMTAFKTFGAYPKFGMEQVGTDIHLFGNNNSFDDGFIYSVSRSGSVFTTTDQIPYTSPLAAYGLLTLDDGSAVSLQYTGSSTLTFSLDAYGATPVTETTTISSSDVVTGPVQWGDSSWFVSWGPAGANGQPNIADATVTSAWFRVLPVNNAHCGEKVVKYEVNSDLYPSYTLSPRGPDNDTHHSAFKIADESRTVSAMVSIANELGQDFYVRPMARFLAWSGTDFTTISVQNLGAAVHLTGDGEWTTLTRLAGAPEGATHWYFDLSLSASSDGSTPPVLGSVLYADCCYIPDNGLNVASEPYLDGDQVGTIRGDGQWEGVAHNSTSIWAGEEEPPPDEGDLGDGGGGDAGGDGDPGDSGTDAPPDEPPPPPPVEPPAPPTIEEVAEDLLSGTQPSGLCLDADVQLGPNMLFNTVDEFGVLWVVSDIDGWWNLPEPDVPDFPRGVDDGSYEARGRYQARVFTLSGSFFPPSKSAVRPARDRLLRAANLCHFGAWFATREADATRASKVWLSGQPQISTVNVNGRTDFSIGLKAPDPIKYGLIGGELPGYNAINMVSHTAAGLIGREYDLTFERSYGGGESNVADVGVATNAGNVRVYPIITVIGPTIGPISIVNNTTEQTLRVRLSLAAGETLTIDCQNRVVQRGELTNQRFYLDTVTDWIYLDPGANEFMFTEELGGSPSQVQVQWRSGWIG